MMSKQRIQFRSLSFQVMGRLCVLVPCLLRALPANPSRQEQASNECHMTHSSAVCLFSFCVRTVRYFAQTINSWHQGTRTVRFVCSCHFAPHFFNAHVPPRKPLQHRGSCIVYNKYAAQKDSSRETAFRPPRSQQNKIKPSHFPLPAKRMNPSQNRAHEASRNGYATGLSLKTRENLVVFAHVRGGVARVG
jgi:hypothetical protein